MAGEVVLDRVAVELVAQTEGFRRDMQRAAREFQRIGTDMQRVGRELTTSVSLPLAGIGIAAFKAAADFETAMTGVAKTVDAPASAIAELGQNFRRLSEEIPVATNDLARLAEVGGQLGIEVENLEGFVETMAALGVATNLSAEEAGTALARLSNIMGTAQTEFDRMGSVIVDLGNNLATTEREIVAFSTRMAGAARVAGLTEADVLAIGGALSSVGVEAEAGGTAVQKVLIDINTAVAESNEQLALFAQTAGMSAQDFADAWRADAGAAFTAFVEGIGRAGDDAVTILADLGLENQRLIRAFLALGNAGPLLADALDLANKAWFENLALTEEAERFYDRMAARLVQLRNQAVNVAAEFGQSLAPGFELLIRVARDVLDVVRDLNEAFRTMPEWVRAATVAVAALAAAVGPAVLAMGTMVKLAGTLAAANVAVAVTGWATAFASLAVQVRSLSAAFALLQVAIGPTGWIIAGLGVFATAIAGGALASAKLRRELQEMDDDLREVVEGMREFGEAATRASLEDFTAELVKAQAEVERIKAEIADEPQGGLLGGRPGLQRELVEAQRQVEIFSVLVEGAAKRWTEFGQGAQDVARSVAEIAAEFERVSIGGFDRSELAALTALQRELQVIVSDTEASTEERLSATRLLARVTAEIERLQEATTVDLDKQLDLLGRAVDLDLARAEEFAALQRIAQDQLAILRDQTRSLEEQVDAAERLRDAEEAINDLLRQRPFIEGIENARLTDSPLVPGGGFSEREAARRRRLGLSPSTFVPPGGFDIADLGLGEDFQRDVQAAAQRLRAEFGDLSDTINELAVADAVVGGLAALADGLFDLEQGARAAVRGISDIIGGLAAIRNAEGGLSSLTGAAGALGIFGAGVGILRAITGGDRAADIQARELAERRKEANRILEENNRRLEALNKSLTEPLGAPEVSSEIRIVEDLIATIGGIRGAGASPFGDLFNEIPRGLAKLGLSFEEFFDGLNRDEIRRAFEGLGGSFEVLERIAREQDITLFDDLGNLVPGALAQLGEAAALLVEEIERQQEAIAQNLEIERLRVLGLDEEARALENTIAVQEALADGWTDANIAALRHVQALREEAAARREAERVADLARDFGVLFAEQMAEAALREGDVDAFREAQRIIGEAQIEQALAPFAELVEQGIISEEAFTLLAATMRGNLNAAIEETIQSFEDAADAAREAAQAERFRQMVDKENLRVQILLAQGRDSEARALEKQLQIIEAIQAGRDAEYIALLQTLQAAQDAERALKSQKRAQDDLNRSIAQTTRALNAPAGLRLSLLRWRALVTNDGPSIRQSTAFATGGTSGPIGGTRTTSSGETTQIRIDNVTLNPPAGMSGKEIYKEVEKESKRIQRLGGQTLQDVTNR